MDINMSVNNSSFAHLPHAHVLSSSNSSLDPLMDRCSRSTKGILIITAFSSTNILVMFPISITVLYLGFRQWSQQCSNPTAATSSSDIFTYNMSAVVLIEVLGSVVYFVGRYSNVPDIVYLYECFCTAWSTKMQVHMLTCVERYVAVVHPVTYLVLKSKSGVRARKISIGCIWLQFVLLVAFIPKTTSNMNLIVLFCNLVFALIIISFCSVSVLCALRRPGPGEVGADREQVDQLKQRAFHTITAIMGTLLLSLGGLLVCSAMYVSSVLKYSDSCVAMMSFLWFSLPSSLVLPLLYLYRAEKLPGCTQRKETD